MTEQELLVDCLQRLNSAEIQYMVTGSIGENSLNAVLAGGIKPKAK
jgi:hypothetical protein